MRQFTIQIESRLDIPAVLSDSLKNMGSLGASREQWAALLIAMDVDLVYAYHEDAPMLEVREAANAIVSKAIPVESGLHPQRAIVTYANIVDVRFLTPGGVVVEIGHTADGIILSVDFRRNSKYLATLILADMFRRVPAAVPLLAEAANEAAEKYEADLASAQC